MTRKTIDSAGDAVKALLSTMLGETAPLKFGVLQPVEALEVRDDAESLLGIHPEDGSFAVLLDPAWLPLIAGLKLGVQTRVGDEDYEPIVQELASLFASAVKAHFSSQGTEINPGQLVIKEPGSPLADETFDLISGRLPFFMEWDGAILHGFALLGPVESEDSETQEAQQEADTPGEEASTQSMAAPMHQAPEQKPIPVRPAAFPDLGIETIAETGGSGLGLLADVELEVTVELGRRRMPLSEILRLTNGSVLELEKLVGEPLQVYANNRFIAEGEAVVVDEQFGVRITALASRGTERIVR